jgi:soluble lytic murein transglycosylase-like protein
MSRELTSGASVPSTNKAEILAALNNVAAEYRVDPAAIAAVIDMELKWDTTSVTGRYIGLVQVGPELPREMGLTRAQFLALSAGKQTLLPGGSL